MQRPFYAYRSNYSVLRQLVLMVWDGQTERVAEIAKLAYSPKLRAQAQAVLTRINAS